MVEPIIPPMYNHPAMEAVHKRLQVYGQCYQRGGNRVADSTRLEVVSIDPSSRIVGPSRDNPSGKRIVSTNYAESETRTRRDWQQTDIDEARILHNLVTTLPIQRSLVVQCFYGHQYAEIWTTLPADRQDAILFDLTHQQGRPRGVNARIADHNREAGDWVPDIVHELFLTILHRATRELLARLRGVPVSAKSYTTQYAITNLS